MKDIVLKIDKVSYRYSDADKDDYVLKNISYNFQKGKTYAIRGKSGSGKTTLLSLISGLEKCREGHIYYKDKDLSKMNLDKYRNTSIGIIFQSYNLLPTLSAIENVIMSMNISKLNLNQKQKEAKALELLKSVGITTRTAKRRILRLSGGEQQRVAIARSLSYNPDIILADEPTGNLDPETEGEILNIFKSLAKEENKCVIIVTHSKTIADGVDIVYELKKNKL
jgi:putative ABC transport system ATP-binding protein